MQPHYENVSAEAMVILTYEIATTGCHSYESMLQLRRPVTSYRMSWDHGQRAEDHRPVAVPHIVLGTCKQDGLEWEIKAAMSSRISLYQNSSPTQESVLFQHIKGDYAMHQEYKQHGKVTQVTTSLHCVFFIK